MKLTIVFELFILVAVVILFSCNSKPKEKTDKEMAEWMTKECKLAPIPVSAFYKDKTDHKLLRFCFAKGEDTLRKAGEILKML